MEPSSIELRAELLLCFTAMPPATEAIETALDLAVFRRELIEGTEAMFGVRIQPFDRCR